MTTVNGTLASAASTASSLFSQLVHHEATFRYGDHDIPVQYVYTLALAAGVVTLSKLYSTIGSSNDQGIPRKYGYPIVGSWAFFTQRYQFIDDGIKKLGNIFSFKILNVSSTWFEAKRFLEKY